MHRREEQRDGKPASFSGSAAVPWDGQGTEFNRSFRKLSGSVISESRPGNRGRGQLGAGMHRPRPAESWLPHPRRAHTVLQQVLTAAHWKLGRDWGKSHRASAPFCKRGPAPEPGATVCWRASQWHRLTSQSAWSSSKPGSLDHSKGLQTECKRRGTFGKESVHSRQHILKETRTEERLMPLPWRTGEQRRE